MYEFHSDERACLEVYSELLPDAIGKTAGEALSSQHSAFSQKTAFRRYADFPPRGGIFACGEADFVRQG